MPAGQVRAREAQEKKLALRDQEEQLALRDAMIAEQQEEQLALRNAMIAEHQEWGQRHAQAALGDRERHAQAALGDRVRPQMLMDAVASAGAGGLVEEAD